MVMKRRRIIKNKSRIPGISVGEEVDTSIGEKKKVCCNINGRWFFRMVDPDWRAPRKATEGQRSEVRGRRSTTRGEATKGGSGRKKREERQEARGRRRGMKTKWTVMIYMAGDNNLDSAALDDIEELAQVGSFRRYRASIRLFFS